MVQYHPKAAVDAVTKTVGSGKDFTTIQAAIDWFEARIITGACYIDADAGTYDEAVDFSGLLIAGGASLTLRGDTRVLAGLSFVDGAAINQGALANGGSGTGALSNAGANITVTGTITNPDFDADSWGSGDKILVYDNAGAITEHTIDSVLNNVITLTAASPAIGNDATAIVLLPDRRIERTEAGNCIDAIATKGIGIDGFYIEPLSGHGIYGSIGSVISVENCVAYNATFGYASEIGYATLTSYGGAVSAWGCTYGFISNDAGQIRSLYTVSVGDTFGFFTQNTSYLRASNSIAVNTTNGYTCQLFSNMYVDTATARQNTIGYYCASRGYLYAVSTNANNNGNGTNYNPAVSDVFGNSNGSITWS